MQNSAKHLIAVLAVFIAYTASVYITQAYNTEAAAVLSTIYTLSFSAVLAAICIIIAIRHQKQRRYFLSLSMIMLCFCFAELYIGIHTLVKEAAASFIITLPITELSYLGATAFMAAFCARIWYEEIPKTEIKPGKSILASAVAVLLFLIPGLIGISAGFPLIIGILYALFDAAAVWYAVKFFIIPKTAKPFLPLMAAITLYLIIDMLWTFIISLIPAIPDEPLTGIILQTMTLLQMLLIPFLVYAGEQIEKRAQEKTETETMSEGA